MHGEYDVKAGISALSKDRGNGHVDRQVFQIDEHFDAYREAKLHARQRPEQHVLRDRLSPGVESTIASWMTTRLQAEYADRELECSTGASLDDVALSIQADLAVLQLDDRLGNRLSYLNVAMPSGWSPEEKIGRPFDRVHAPVPHIESLNQKQDAIAKLMVGATRGAVRFAWTVTDDAALNHHPHRDRSIAHASPLPDHPPSEPLLRVERQVIWGFPEHRSALFLIRTYLYPFDGLASSVRSSLSRAVAGMSDASLAYKNMNRARILERLA
jgi:hypothetical protein